MQLVNEFVVAFLAFFAIMNPISILPVFLGLTADDDVAETRLIARRGLLIAFGIITVFALAGQYIFQSLSITLPALRIAGGLVIFWIGFRMLESSPSSPDRKTLSVAASVREQQLSVAISPIAMPLLAGPGTIATALNLSTPGGIVSSLIAIGAFAVLCLISYVLFVNGKRVVHSLGKSAMNVITRLMGLLLAVIGVQMVITGIQGAFPILS